MKKSRGALSIYNREVTQEGWDNATTKEVFRWSSGRVETDWRKKRWQGWKTA